VRRAMAMVLAGGRSEGLGVLTVPRAAPALPFGGKYRVIDFTLSNCLHSEIFHVAILTQHQPTSLVEHIGAGRPWDLSRLESGVQILQPFARRDRSHWYRGTADAIAQNTNAIEDARADHVLVTSGDHVVLMDYGPMMRAHEESGARVTLAVKLVPRALRSRYGMIELDAEERVVRFEEKPATTDVEWASMGLYVFDAAWLLKALATAPGPDLVYDILLPALAAGEPMRGWRFDGYWEDVGELSTYYRASCDLLSEHPVLRLDDPAWTVLTRNEERPPARFGARARVHNSLVAAGARIDGTLTRSVVFPGAWIEEGAVVEDAIVFHDAWIGRGARVVRGILDKDVIVGEGAEVGGPADGAELLTVLGKESIVLTGERVPAGANVPVAGGRGRSIPVREAVAGTRGEWPR